MRHYCPRCGLESNCSRGSWPDRHPVAAVVAGCWTLTFMGMMLSVHPIAAAVLIGVAAVGGGVYMAVRERRRREALAARADYENRQILAASVKWPALPAPAPTRRRPADHWSPTEPIKATGSRA
jgi:hypothetical protein